MPKGKRKGKFEHRRTEQVVESSDEDAGIDMTLDNCSETSGQSDLKSNHEEGENDTQEKFEEKVLEIIDGLSARSNAARAVALSSLRNVLQRRYVGSLLANQRVTLADTLARTLRRGRDAERRAAAALAPLLALQIGDEGTEEYLNELRPALTATATDRSASLDTRTECCSSLAALCYLLEEDFNEILEIMRMFETIFSESYLKGDGSVKVSGAAVEQGPWAAAALEGWALLLATLPPAAAQHALHGQPPDFARLAQLLHAASLDVRLAAGPALALAHEALALAGTPPELEPELLAALEQLASDSHKYRAKRDRKVQRATFRDVLKYFGGGAAPSHSARVGGELLSADTWGGLAAHGALAGALGAGLAALDPHCAVLRAALGLPDALPAHAPPAHKLNKLQRHLQNSAACKARTLARNKNRDKRSAALAL